MHSMRSSRPGPMESPSSWRGVSAEARTTTVRPVIRLTRSSVRGCLVSTRTARGTQERNLCGCRRSEEHTSELQSRQYLVCRLLLEKKNTNHHNLISSYSDSL